MTQGGTATTLTRGPSKGICVARASKAVRHCVHGRLGLTAGGGRFTGPLVRESGLPETETCHSGPRQARSCEVRGTR